MFHEICLVLLCFAEAGERNCSFGSLLAFSRVVLHFKLVGWWWDSFQLPDRQSQWWSWCGNNEVFPGVSAGCGCAEVIGFNNTPNQELWSSRRANSTRFGWKWECWMAWGEEEEWLAALSLTSPVCCWTVCLYVWKARDIFSDCGSHRLSSSITDASSSCLCCVIFLSAKENVPNPLLHYPIVLCILEGASLNSLPRCTRDQWQIPQQGKVIISRSINSSQRRTTYSVFLLPF